MEVLGIHGSLGLKDALNMRFVRKVALQECECNLFLKVGQKWTVKLCFMGKARVLWAAGPNLQTHFLASRPDLSRKDNIWRTFRKPLDSCSVGIFGQLH